METHIDIAARPQFSVIVPVYNRADSVAMALDSVLDQSFQDFELIVIDDGSTDRTASVLQRYADRARLFRQANRGAGAARNCGLAQARGRYAAFLDSDDQWPTWTLAVYAELIQARTEPALFCNNPLMVDANSSLDAPIGAPLAALARKPTRVRNQRDFLCVGRDMRQFTASVLPVAPVAALRTVGGFAAAPVAFEDWDLCLRLGTRLPLVIVEQPTLLLYRRSSAGETGNLARLRAGMEHCLKQEARGAYPGGSSRRHERQAILCSIARFAILSCLLGGEYRQGLKLYRRALGLLARAGRWRLIATLPVLPVLAGRLYRRRDAHFRTNNASS